jgi:hypothetical protein
VILFQVYLTLSEQLPEFGPENWTSEFRGKFSGLEPYEGSSLADFKYSDRQGVLSTTLFDKETTATWEGKWPNYYIEVKSTSEGDGEIFHMSRSQIRHVSENHTFSAAAVHFSRMMIHRLST